jgi:hypothetical protein
MVSALKHISAISFKENTRVAEGTMNTEQFSSLKDSLCMAICIIIIVYGSISPPFPNDRAAIVGCHGR